MKDSGEHLSSSSVSSMNSKQQHLFVKYKNALFDLKNAICKYDVITEVILKRRYC